MITITSSTSCQAQLQGSSISKLGPWTWILSTLALGGRRMTSLLFWTTPMPLGTSAMRIKRIFYFSQKIKVTLNLGENHHWQKKRSFRRLESKRVALWSLKGDQSSLRRVRCITKKYLIAQVREAASFQPKPRDHKGEQRWVLTARASSQDSTLSMARPSWHLRYRSWN